jgi:glycosyltransferase involved in cell wall biosynthesis
MTGVPYERAWQVLRDGPAPLLDAGDGTADRTPLHLAVVLPSLPIGSGGHNVVLQVVHGLEQRGHTCSLWVLMGPHAERLELPAALRRKVREQYAPVRAPVFRGLDDWYGADVAVATSWETAYAVAALPGCRARAYMLNDHEPEFHPTSVERELAERTYGLGLHGLAGSPWLQEHYAARGGSATAFAYGVDHDVYRPRETSRRPDTVAFYGRRATPRRAVPLGLAALAALHARRPGLRVVAFGDRERLAAPFPVEHAGVASPEQLSRLFAEATVGLCLSLTNYSLIPQEMLACGMPCVDLDRPSTRSVYGADGPVALAGFDPAAIASAIERLLDDEAEWERRSRAGLALVRERTWAEAATQVEAGLREALRRRVPA